jgi:hypothetical protein
MNHVGRFVHNKQQVDRNTKDICPDSITEPGQCIQEIMKPGTTVLNYVHTIIGQVTYV